MMDRPQTALLIPVYDNQDGTVKSLSAITSEVMIDIVVVDDGSAPPINLPERINSHSIFVIRLEKNHGIEYALNAGLAWILERDYIYIARLDAGDIPLPGRFAKQIAFLETHLEYAMVGGQVWFLNEKRQKIFDEVSPTEDANIRRVMHARDCFSHPAIMIRAQVLREVGFYSDKYKDAEDYELFFRVMQRHKVANLPDRILEYEVRPGGISLKKRRRQILSRLKIMLHYFDPLVMESYLGLLKSTVLLITPYNWVVVAKKFLGERREGWF